MTIALIAHDSKKELMVQFCTAYCRILSQHKLVATGTTGKLIAEATGLQVQRFLPPLSELQSMRIPVLSLETDYADTDAEQLRTRIGAFIEMLND